MLCLLFCGIHTLFTTTSVSTLKKLRDFRHILRKNVPKEFLKKNNKKISVHVQNQNKRLRQQTGRELFERVLGKEKERERERDKNL